MNATPAQTLTPQQAQLLIHAKYVRAMEVCKARGVQVTPPPPKPEPIVLHQCEHVEQ